MQDTIDKLKEAFRTTIDTNEKREKADKLYWLYRLAKENPKELEVAFLLEANRLQKSVMDDMDSQYAEYLNSVRDPRD